jgi:hypothetical protein
MKGSRVAILHTMIDAVFYDDVSVPLEVKERIPDWLIAIGTKVQKDLQQLLDVEPDQSRAVQSIKAYLREHRLHLIEPIQVSVYSGQICLYHDWIRGALVEPRSPGRLGAAYDFFRTLIDGMADLCAWDDHTANDIQVVSPMRRHNVGIVVRNGEVNLQVVIELHWSDEVAVFERQVAHFRPLVRPVEVQILDASDVLIERLSRDPDELYRIGPERFEELVNNRVRAMGFATQRTGRPFAKDGGVDLLFWREDASFPFLGALQAKYHWSPDKNTSVSDVRDFAGTIETLPIAVGVMVTNTDFSYDAQWVAKKLQSRIMLRDERDLRRWVSGRFVDALDWREIPDEIELCPGVRISIPKRK